MASDAFIDCADRLSDNNGIYEVIGTVKTAFQSATFIEKMEFRDGAWIIPPHLHDGMITVGMWRPNY